MEKTQGLLNLVYLDSFTVFPEYFITVSSIYVLIVIVLITYNIYGLMLQKAISDCLALMLLMACYLIINDDLLTLNFLSFNNSINNDYFAFFTKLVVCFSSAIYFLIISNFLKEQRLTSFEYLLIILFAILGLVLLCSSNDLLTAYLAIELSSLAFYILASFKKNSNYSIESGLKYFITGAVSSAFFLLGSSFIYGIIGSINFHDFRAVIDTELVDKPPIELVIDQHNPVDLLTAFFYMHWYFTTPLELFESSFVELGLSLIMFSLFIKLGLAPFHLWSLDVYEGSPTSSTFFFVVISKLSFFVLLLRLCYVSFVTTTFKDSWMFYTLWVAVASIFVGSFGGLKTRKLKTLLAYSSTSHMGYILLAFTTFIKSLSVEIIFLYLIIYIIAGLSTWFIILSLRLKNKNVTNKYNKELGDLVLLHRSNSALALALAITMFSIAGIPPMIGFFAKLGVFLSVVQSSFFIFALVTILCSVISTFYYIRIIKILYFENVLVGKLYYPLTNQKILILSLLIFLLLFLFINPTLLYLSISKIWLSLFFKNLFYV